MKPAKTTRPRVTYAALASSTLLLLACGGSNNDPSKGDAAAGADGAAGPDGAATTDGGPPANVCDPKSVVDLTAIAPGSDGVVHYLGNNSAAPVAGGLVAPVGCSVYSSGDQPIFQLAMHYRMRATSGLTVSTNNPGTPQGAAVILMLANACVDRGPASVCGSVVPDSMGGPETRTTIATPGALAAGSDVFVVYGTPSGGAQSAFELTIAEVAPLATGAACDATSVCAVGESCPLVAAVPGAQPPARHCVPDGAAGGMCRLGAERCDAGLGCNAGTPTSLGVCGPAIATGMPCVLSDACVAGSSCVPDDPSAPPAPLGPPPAGHCRADGADGTHCRFAAERCDAGLGCTTTNPLAGGICRTPIAAGKACAGGNDACVAGYTCATSMMGPPLPGGVVLGPGLCVPEGSEGASCRFTQDRCDAGLVCNNASPIGAGQCGKQVAVGMVCRQALDICAPGSYCIADSSATGPAPGTAHCRNPGADGGTCRKTAPRCDTGLGCSAPTDADPGICGVPLANGAACNIDTSACVAGSTCTPNDGSFSSGTCRPDSSEGGLCTMANMTCAAGTSCHAFGPTHGLCQTPIATGMSCDPRFDLCATGASCVGLPTTPGKNPTGQCRLDGGIGGACHKAQPVCDQGLECGPTGTCDRPCNTVVPSATAKDVTATAGTGTAPVGKGGAIVPGRYNLASMTVYGGIVQPGTFRTTEEFSDSTVSQVTMQTAPTAATTHTSYTYTTAADGTFIRTVTCPSAFAGQRQVGTYDATPTTITVYLPAGPSTIVYQFAAE
jgi:hypothetical protein